LTNLTTVEFFLFLLTDYGRKVLITHLKLFQKTKDALRRPLFLNGSRGGIPSLRPIGAGRLTKCATDSGVGSYDTIEIVFVFVNRSCRSWNPT